MKAVISDGRLKAPSEYPCLKVLPEGTVMLFFKARVGTVVYAAPNSGHSLGEHYAAWDEGRFTTYDGTVMLSN